MLLSESPSREYTDDDPLFDRDPADIDMWKEEEHEKSDEETFEVNEMRPARQITRAAKDPDHELTHVFTIAIYWGDNPPFVLEPRVFARLEEYAYTSTWTEKSDCPERWKLLHSVDFNKESAGIKEEAGRVLSPEPEKVESQTIVFFGGDDDRFEIEQWMLRNAVRINGK